MTAFYFDSSALVKLYIPENGSLRVDQIVNARDPAGEVVNAVFFSIIGIAETCAAISRRKRNGDIDEEIRIALTAAFLYNSQQHFTTLAINDETVLLAAELTTRFPLRGYDAVHLATALAFNQILLASGEGQLVFISADNKLLQAAHDSGLRIENPVDLISFEATPIIS